MQFLELSLKFGRGNPAMRISVITISRGLKQS